MSDHYDVLVVGAGPAGTAAALHACELGARTAVVDRRRTGGTCTNTGCVPTRVLAITARLLRDIRGASVYGIEIGEPQVIWPRTRARVRQVIGEVHANKRTPDKIRRAGGQLFLEGTATFTSPNTVRLEDTGREISADKIILCVGGKSRRLPLQGIEHAMFPENVLDLEQLPRSLVIVGSGYTGVQVTTIMNAFGVHVTLLEMLPTVLPTADKDVGRLLRDSFEQQGVRVVTGIKGLEGIELLDNGMRRVSYTHADRQYSLDVDAVMVAAGWPASVESLGLEAAGVTVERGFVRTDKFLRTNVEHIFAAGDVNGEAMLVQGAHFEAFAAAENAVRGPTLEFEHRLLPNGGFTDPDHAGVGLTEDEARKEGREYVAAVAHYADLDRAIIDNRKAGFLKLLVDKQSEQIIGAHAAGENAVEVIQAVATAMAAKATIAALAGIELAYPSYAAILGAAASQLVPNIGYAAMRHTPPLRGDDGAD